MTPILSGGGVWAWANGHQAHGGEAGRGHGRAGKSDRFPTSYSTSSQMRFPPQWAEI